MPELPEVETTRRGIAPQLVGQRVTEVKVREARLRWPVPRALARELTGQTLHAVERRGKYLLLRADTGTAILHLGMSGSVRLVASDTPAGKHEHVDIVLGNGLCLRLTDPRRFGSLHWTRDDPLAHPLLIDLGPEPLTAAFSGEYLAARAQGRKVSVKQFLMDSHTVVGVGNIYASEALFLAGIDPRRAAGRIAAPRYERLAEAIKTVLTAAIKQGGTTLRDFSGGDGKPGYFKQFLRVYGREGEPCTACGRPVRLIRQGQRASYLCAQCQR
jgi:formamidopyrimidine-DNA glycosylase